MGGMRKRKACKIEFKGYQIDEVGFLLKRHTKGKGTKKRAS